MEDISLKLLEILFLGKEVTVKSVISLMKQGADINHLSNVACFSSNVVKYEGFLTPFLAAVNNHYIGVDILAELIKYQTPEKLKLKVNFSFSRHEGRIHESLIAKEFNAMHFAMRYINLDKMHKLLEAPVDWNDTFKLFAYRFLMGKWDQEDYVAGGDALQLAILSASYKPEDGEDIVHAVLDTGRFRILDSHLKLAKESFAEVYPVLLERQKESNCKVVMNLLRFASSIPVIKVPMFADVCVVLAG